MKLCGGLNIRVRFVCSVSMTCDEFSALCCGGTGELAVQLFHSSHFHDLSMFGLLFIGARIARIVALVCIDMSYH